MRKSVLDVSEEDREVLQSRVQARTMSVCDRERARIVLLAADGLPAAQIAEKVGSSWWAETYRFSTDPELVAEATDIVGLYLPPPEGRHSQSNEPHRDTSATVSVSPMIA